MMLHRHFEEAEKNENLTTSKDFLGHSDTTDPNDPLYAPTGEEVKPRRGRPPKEVKHETE